MCVLIYKKLTEHHTKILAKLNKHFSFCLLFTKNLDSPIKNKLRYSRLIFYTLN